MKPTNEKPVKAHTAGAMDTFDVSESHNVQQANNISGGHYIGDNNEKLFTSDEVNTLIRERLDRQLKSLLSKYELSSKEELDSLVSLAKKMNEVYKSYNSSHQTNIERNPLTMEQQQKPLNKDNGISDVINLLKDRDYCSISFIQKSLNVGFSKAGRYFATLADAGVLDRTGDSKGCKIHKDKLSELLDLSEEQLSDKLYEIAAKRRIAIDRLYQLNNSVSNKRMELVSYKNFLNCINLQTTKEFEIEITKCILLCDHLISRYDEREPSEYEKLEKDFNQIKNKMSDLVKK